jgi:hypothetical protein
MRKKVGHETARDVSESREGGCLREGGIVTM